jgi:hypothetical protein
MKALGSFGARTIFITPDIREEPVAKMLEPLVMVVEKEKEIIVDREVVVEKEVVRGLETYSAKELFAELWRRIVGFFLR